MNGSCGGRLGGGCVWGGVEWDGGGVELCWYDDV